MSIRISCSVLTFHAGRRMESELTSQVKEPLTALNTPICARKGMAMFTLKTWLKMPHLKKVWPTLDLRILSLLSPSKVNLLLISLGTNYEVNVPPGENLIVLLRQSSPYGYNLSFSYSSTIVFSSAALKKQVKERGNKIARRDPRLNVVRISDSIQDL